MYIYIYIFHLYVGCFNPLPVEVNSEPQVGMWGMGHVTSLTSHQAALYLACWEQPSNLFMSPTSAWDHIHDGVLSICRRSKGKTSSFLQTFFAVDEQALSRSRFGWLYNDVATQPAGIVP